MEDFLGAHWFELTEADRDAVLFPNALVVAKDPSSMGSIRAEDTRAETNRPED
jgi:hypothetical protein